MLNGRLYLPASLRGVFFDFLWDKRKVWRLPTQPEQASFRELAWHLELPVWSTSPPRPLFDLAPIRVLSAPSLYPEHWQRVLAARLEYPLELFRNGDRWVILDGYHRLAHHSVLGTELVPVRRHDRSLLGLIHLNEKTPD
jgi:hypothetical protein